MNIESIVEDFYNVPNKLRKHKNQIKMNNELKESIQVIGNCVYLHSVDECGECTQLIGHLSEMSEQDKDYYGIK